MPGGKNGTPFLSLLAITPLPSTLPQQRCGQTAIDRRKFAPARQKIACRTPASAPIAELRSVSPLPQQVGSQNTISGFTQRFILELDETAQGVQDILGQLKSHQLLALGLKSSTAIRLALGWSACLAGRRPTRATRHTRQTQRGVILSNFHTFPLGEMRYKSQ
jgi:hypothetical protein